MPTREKSALMEADPGVGALVSRAAITKHVRVEATVTGLCATRVYVCLALTRSLMEMSLVWIAEARTAPPAPMASSVARAMTALLEARVASVGRAYHAMTISRTVWKRR